VFGSVVAVAFQIAFRTEIHANDFFYFLKIIFDISTSKRYKKYKPHSILAKKKFQNLTKRSYKHNAKQSLHILLAIKPQIMALYLAKKENVEILHDLKYYIEKKSNP